MQNLHLIQSKGKELFGTHFQIYHEDHEFIQKLLAYFTQDKEQAQHFNLNLNKGLLITGPVGCGKTSLITVMRHLLVPDSRFAIKSCREITFEFISGGYEVIQRYSTHAYSHKTDRRPSTHCFDDLGAESAIKYYGNQCNVMGEILLSRYDHFIANRMLTHATTNLSASELEDCYGNRVRSRMRELFNLVAFNSEAKDKRK